MHGMHVLPPALPHTNTHTRTHTHTHTHTNTIHDVRGKNTVHKERDYHVYGMADANRRGKKQEAVLNDIDIYRIAPAGGSLAFVTRHQGHGQYYYRPRNGPMLASVASEQARRQGPGEQRYGYKTTNDGVE